MQEDVLSRVNQVIEEEYPSLFSLYTTLHQHPELSEMEEQTALALSAALEAAGCSVSNGIGGFGIAGVLGAGPGRTVLVRADMDALPVLEETGLPYASTETTADWNGRQVPVMHACGHDLHMTVLVGVARVMATLQGQWSGRLLLVGQPSEERVSGAAAMVADGLYTTVGRPDALLALHVAAEYPVGTVIYTEGVSSAGAESLDLKIFGVGGHAAHPDKAIDPILIAAETILLLQTVVSREIDPQAFAVLTVSSVHGGSKHNAIPGEVDLTLNLRYFSREVRDHLISAIERIAFSVARGAGVPEQHLPVLTLLDESALPMVCDPVLTRRVITAIQAVLGEDHVIPVAPSSGSEDFSAFGAFVPPIPLCYFRVGSADPHSPHPEAYLHSGRFSPDAAGVIRTGVRAMSTALLALLGDDAKQR